MIIQYKFKGAKGVTYSQPTTWGGDLNFVCSVDPVRGGLPIDLSNVCITQRFVDTSKFNPKDVGMQPVDASTGDVKADASGRQSECKFNAILSEREGQLRIPGTPVSEYPYKLTFSEGGDEVVFDIKNMYFRKRPALPANEALSVKPWNLQTDEEKREWASKIYLKQRGTDGGDHSVVAGLGILGIDEAQLAVIEESAEETDDDDDDDML